MNEFLTALRRVEGMGAKALEFAVLTACRCGEVRGAMWDEIDFSKAVWTIPAARGRQRTQLIPLSPAAVRLLESLERLPGNNLVFPAVRGGTLSDMTLTAAIHDERLPKDGGRLATASSLRVSLVVSRLGWRDNCISAGH